MSRPFLDLGDGVEIRVLEPDDAKEIFDLEYAIDPWVWAVGLAAGAAIVGGAGTFAARGVVNHPPISTLREG